MKKVNLILWIVILFISLISSQSFSWIYVCVDPGHGGIDDGTHGHVYGLLEKDVNLGVGLMTYSRLVSWYWWPIITRTEDVFLYPEERADTANKANDGYGVDAFVSIHHNASPDTITPDTITNYTMTLWCNEDSTDSNWVRRDTTDTLATKVYYKLLDKFHYPPHGVDLNCGLLVLRLTKMGSTLSEASFLSCAEVERKFYYFFDEECGKEGDAIARGTASYLEHAGITVVKNSYQGGNAGNLIVSKWDWFSDICFDTDTVTSPYTTCWIGGMLGETYCLEAITPQWMGGYQRTFHHWAHLDHLGNPDDFCYEPLWKLWVHWPEYDYHKYVAYFSGGPYSAEVISPNGEETWYVAEQETIKWSASIGADSTTWVYIYLDRNGGNDGYPEYLGCQEAKLFNYLPWTVTGPVSAHCKVKVVAEDVAGNSDWDDSDFDFRITGSGNNNPVIEGRLHCRDPQEECNECIKWGDSLTLEIFAHDPDADSIYYEWYAWGGFFTGHFENGYDTMTTAENYVEYFAPSKAKAESPALRQAQGGEQSRTTEGRDGAKNQSQDPEFAWDVFLKVTVVDIRGGSDDTSGYLGIYDPGTSCLCGDANSDTYVSSADMVFLINYLYKGGPAPYPLEKADVNNDCMVKGDDAVYLINYLFKGGPPPECCWIH